MILSREFSEELLDITTTAWTACLISSFALVECQFSILDAIGEWWVSSLRTTARD